ncbi:MAG: PhnA domain-containing protein [Ghiorsea sp.]|nr:PhnA domain-containing protein [Ghiorsea sp.]
MSFEQALETRSGNKCELCGNTDDLHVYEVPNSPTEGVDAAIYACGTCNTQLNDADSVNANHWRCLNDSMWSEVDAVKVVAYRMLNQLKGEGWTQDLLDMMYLEDDVRAWAEAGVADDDAEEAIVHRDSNGAILEAGDSITIIKDLVVKGGGFTAKRGTAVRNIRLVHDNPEHIEGRVNGQMIVILTEFIKKN